MPGPHGGMLRVEGLCAYCESPTRVTCRLCGRAVCDDHVMEDSEVCVDCGAGRVAEE